MSFFLVILSFVFLISIFLIICSISMMKSKGGIGDIRFWWKILMIESGVVLIIEAYIALRDIEHFFMSETIPFTLHLLLEWFFIALSVSMIIVAGLRSKLTKSQIGFFPSLLFTCTIIALCYHYFVGTYTPLHDWRDIFRHISEKDVQVKVFIFVCSLLSTTYLLYVPLYKSLIRKKVEVTKWFWTYIFFAFLQPITYFFYALGSAHSGVILGVGCITFVSIFTVAFIREENPLIRQKDSGDSFEQEIGAIPGIVPNVEHMDISTKISALLSNIIIEEKLFLNKKFSIDELSIKTAIPPSNIISEYQRMGYAGFADYLNSFRLPYFKQLLRDNPKVPISRLASDSGFPSRSGFYRYFQAVEGITPSEYKV